MPPVPAYVAMGEENLSQASENDADSVGRYVLLVVALVLFHLIACVSPFPTASVMYAGCLHLVLLIEFQSTRKHGPWPCV